MKNKPHRRLVQCGIASSFLMLATMSHAETTLVSPSRYSVTEGVAFTLGNTGVSDFLFNWTDPTGASPASFSNIADPTLVLTLGQTYTFQRITGSHPFAIMNNSAAAFISGSDGSYLRTSQSSTDINNATLTPIADFTANPGPTTDLITWTPSQVGDYWYTCSVTSHPSMTGKIIVIPESTVNPVPPSIVDHPAPQTVIVPNAATISVTADGVELNYQWQRRTSAAGEWTNLSGATTSSYTTGATSLSMNGYEYRCRVSNGGGVVASDAAGLTVNSDSSGPVKMAVGEDVEFSLAAIDGQVIRLRGLPRGLRFDAARQVVTGIPTAPHRSGGSYVVSALVLRPDGSRVPEQLLFDVEPMPTWISTSYQAYLGVSEPANAGDILGRGGMLELKINTGGIYSGRLRLGSRAIAFRGQFEGFVGQNLPGSIVTTSVSVMPVRNDRSQDLALDLRITSVAGGFASLSGEVRANSAMPGGGVGITGWQNPWHQRNNPAWGSTSRLQMNTVFDAVTAPGASTAFPSGSGFAVVTMQGNGTAVLMGTLADGERFAGRAIISSGGDFFVYQNLYRNNGVVRLVMQTDIVGSAPSHAAGELDWVKFPDSRASSYEGGFDLRTTVISRPYLAPTSGQTLFSENNVLPQSLVLALTGLGIGSDPALGTYSVVGTNSVQIPVQLDSRNRLGFTPDVPGRPRISLTARSGLTMGTMRLPRQFANGREGTINTRFSGIYLPGGSGSPGRVHGYFDQPVLTPSGPSRQLHMGNMVIETGAAMD